MRTGARRTSAKLWPALVGLLWSLSAAAADLTTLKADGVVGERADGYLGLVQKEVSADARALVDQVNAKRKAEYARIATAHKIPVEQVEALAGKKTLAKTEAGAWIYIESWRRK